MNDITFKVGDTVSFCGLSGFVKEITEAETLLVYFPTDGCSYEFFSDGSLYDGQEEPMLTLTHKGKKKITLNLWINVYAGGDFTETYLNKEEAEQNADKYNENFVTMLHVSEEIEV